jgi:hypothetical protein
MALKPFLAGHAAKMKGFAFPRDLEFGRLLVQNNTAHWIFRHYSCLDLMEEYTFCLLSLTVKKEKIWGRSQKLS